MKNPEEKNSLPRGKKIPLTSTKREWKVGRLSHWLHDFLFFTSSFKWGGGESTRKATGKRMRLSRRLPRDGARANVPSITSVTSCRTLWWDDKVGWPQHQTSCTFEWIVRADRKAGDSKRLCTAAKSASTPCPACPFFFNCCWTRWSAAVTSCNPEKWKCYIQNTHAQLKRKYTIMRVCKLPTIFCMPLLSR